MNKKFKLFLKVILFIIVIIISGKLRFYKYDSVPLPGQSMDEYSNSWVGLSLLKIGVPVGLSGIDGYKKTDYRYINVDQVFSSTAGGNPLMVNYPWFDHPPLMGLISGGWAYLKGAKSFEETNAFIIRKPVVMLGIVSVALLFIYGWLNYSYKVGLISGLIYGTAPLMVISSRMVQAENGVIPLFLLSLVFYSISEKRKSWKWLFLSGVFSGLAILFKLSGVVVFLTIVMMMIVKEKKINLYLMSNILFYGLIVFSIGSWFFIYGLVFDIKQFLAIFWSNSSRYYGLGAAFLFDLFKQSRLTHVKFITEAWPLLGWISVIILFFKKENFDHKKWIVIPVIMYLIIYLFFGSQPFGWYAYPFLPFLCLAIGWLIVEVKTIEQYWGMFICLLLPLGLGIARVVEIDKFQKYSQGWRFGMVCLLLAFPILINCKSTSVNKILKYFIYIVLGITILLNIKYCLMIDVDFWYKVS